MFLRFATVNPFPKSEVMRFESCWTSREPYSARPMPFCFATMLSPMRQYACTMAKFAAEYARLRAPARISLI